MKKKIAFICALLLTVSCTGTTNTQASKKYTLNHTKYELTVGNSVKLKVKGQSKVKWSSKNKKIATVSSKGVVKAKRVGVTTIIAKVKKKKLSCKIKVRKKVTSTATSSSTATPIPTQSPASVTTVSSGSVTGSTIEAANCVFQVIDANYVQGVLTTKVMIKNMRTEGICMGIEPQFYKWNTVSNQWDSIHNTTVVASVIRGVPSNMQLVEPFRCTSNSDNLGAGQYKIALNDILAENGSVLLKNVELEFSINS